MSDRVDGRVHTAREDSFVVFVVGMRLNALWRVRRWLPVFLAAARMRRETPAGRLVTRTLVGWRTVQFVQYWASFEALESYARSREHDHRPAWERFEQRADGSVGVFHETYLVSPGEYETVYRDVPPIGLAAADGSDRVAATARRERARGRLRAGDAGESGHGDGDAQR